MCHRLKIQTHRDHHSHSDQPAGCNDKRGPFAFGNLGQCILRAIAEIIETFRRTFDFAIPPMGKHFRQVTHEFFPLTRQGNIVLFFEKRGEGKVFDLVQAFIDDRFSGKFQIHRLQRLAMPQQRTGIGAGITFVGIAEVTAKPRRLLMAKIAQPVIAGFVTRSRVCLTVADKGDLGHGPAPVLRIG